MPCKTDLELLEQMRVKRNETKRHYRTHLPQHLYLVGTNNQNENYTMEKQQLTHARETFTAL
jgi:hypothetical protein